MIANTSPYGLGITVALAHDDALQRTRAALAAEGFGVLTEIDLAATLRGKLGVAMSAYTILGACNPPLAHQAVSAEPDIGLLLPCNVIVRAGDDPGSSVIAALDPVAALRLADNQAIEPMAAEVRRRLERALDAVRAAAPDAGGHG